jgi:hypothetical protein
MSKTFLARRKIKVLSGNNKMFVDFSPHFLGIFGKMINFADRL